MSVNAEMRNWVFVRVETDDPGLYGWGEATLEWKTRSVVGAVEDLAPLIVGRDPRDIEQAVRVMKKQSFWRLGAIGTSAISGIEMALWDILGKHLGVPVWRLLGGKVRDKVGVYTHLGLGDMRAVYETTDADPLVLRARELLDLGYRAFKAVFIPYTHFHAPLPEVDKVARLMEALRRAVGPEIEIMVDFHGRPASAAAACPISRRWPRVGRCSSRSPSHPATRPASPIWPPGRASRWRPGSGSSSGASSPDLLAARAVAVIQPDICHCGGLLEAKKIAAHADTFGVGVAPHNPLGPIAGVAALHFAVSTPNHMIQEEMVGAVPWYFDVVQGRSAWWTASGRFRKRPARHRDRRGGLRPPPLRPGGAPHPERRARRRHGGGLVSAVTGRLAGKVAIVTGAGRGIGEATARAFAREGATVVVAEIDPATGRSVAEALARNGHALYLPCDVTDQASVERVAARPDRPSAASTSSSTMRGSTSSTPRSTPARRHGGAASPSTSTASGG